MVHRLTNTGAFTFQHKDKSGQVLEDEGTIHQLGGMLSFIQSVNRFEASRHGKRGDPSRSPKVDGFNKVYRKFIMYRDFFGSDRPVIMFEGKTDNIYIRSAIRSLAKSFPYLAQVAKTGNVTLSVRLYNYTDTTKEILELSGGSDNLRKFILLYRKITSKFQAPKPKFPIVVLIDNDKGAKPIYGLLNELTGVHVTGGEAFLKAHDDIYVVPTPKIGSADSCIEDFFDKSVLTVTLSGKTFDKSNDFDVGNCYGKFAFAKAVVKRNEKTIDFSGFAPILSILSKIIEDHGK